LQIDRALLMQVLGLNLDEMTLFAKVASCVSGRLSIPMGPFIRELLGIGNHAGAGDLDALGFAGADG
jgi:hypothetical protein